ncbi:hypothetical protein N8768_06740 [Flavobacteriaceae bacterium]|jgi:hypothetical protein|nr:hypothetical protein [Flavobacteriaceae bacterium]
MIFKRLKKKSNQKYLNKNLNNRKPLVDDSIIQSVGVILNNNEFRDADQLLSLLRSIDIKENKIKFITLIDDHESRPNSWDAYFYPENFKWKGKIEGADLTDFVNEPFDVLISYYQINQLELHLATTLSKAKFKIGISNVDERLHDLIISIDPNQVEIFKKELLKYLKVFNKI